MSAQEQQQQSNGSNTPSLDSLNERKRSTYGTLSNNELQKKSLNRLTMLPEEKGLIGQLYYDISNFGEINEFDQ